MKGEIVHLKIVCVCAYFVQLLDIIGTVVLAVETIKGIHYSEYDATFWFLAFDSVCFFIGTFAAIAFRWQLKEHPEWVLGEENM